MVGDVSRRHHQNGNMEAMKDSGCFGVKLGFESGNQFVVDKIVNKHLNLDYAADVVHHLKEIGMSVHGTFTYGLPGETPEQRQDTKKYIASLPFDTIQQSGTAEIEERHSQHSLQAERSKTTMQPRQMNTTFPIQMAHKSGAR